MAIKTFSAGSVLTASDTNTYLANSGLVYVTEASATTGQTLSVNNCFTSTYDNYRLVIDPFQPATTAGVGFRLRLRAGLSDATGADYFFGLMGLYVDGSSANTVGNAQTTLDTGIFNTTNTLSLGSSVIDVIRPQKADRTFFMINGILYAGQFGGRAGFGEHNLTTAYDGFTLLTSTGNITSAKVRVYGYRQA